MEEHANVNNAKKKPSLMERSQMESFWVNIRDMRVDSEGKVWVRREAPTLSSPSVRVILNREAQGFRMGESFKTSRENVAWGSVPKADKDFNPTQYIPVIWH